MDSRYSSSLSQAGIRQGQKSSPAGSAALLFLHTSNETTCKLFPSQRSLSLSRFEKKQRDCCSASLARRAVLRRGFPCSDTAELMAKGEASKLKGIMLSKVSKAAYPSAGGREEELPHLLQDAGKPALQEVNQDERKVAIPTKPLRLQ